MIAHAEMHFSYALLHTSEAPRATPDVLHIARRMLMHMSRRRVRHHHLRSAAIVVLSFFLSGDFVDIYAINLVEWVFGGVSRRRPWGKS